MFLFIALRLEIAINLLVDRLLSHHNMSSTPCISSQLGKMNTEAINISFDLNSKIPEFLNECGKYELKSRANQLWYIELIEDVSRITPKLNRLLDLEIKYNQE